MNSFFFLTKVSIYWTAIYRIIATLVSSFEKRCREEKKVAGKLRFWLEAEMNSIWSFFFFFFKSSKLWEHVPLNKFYDSEEICKHDCVIALIRSWNNLLYTRVMTIEDITSAFNSTWNLHVTPRELLVLIKRIKRSFYSCIVISFATKNCESNSFLF